MHSMQKFSSPEYKNRIVAFVDILGFKNLVLSLKNDPALHEKVYLALSKIKSVYTHSQSGHTAQSDLEVSIFSDSIVISSEMASISNIFSVIWTCGWLQAQLFGISILTRGGISQGLTVHEKDIIYGEGMINAYKIESSAAVYPRIVLDPKISQSLNSNIKDKFLDKDFDGLWFIDPFKFHEGVGDADELLADGWDPRELYFQYLEKHIQDEIIKCKEVDHLAKLTWLKNRITSAASDYLRNRENPLNWIFNKK